MSYFYKIVDNVRDITNGTVPSGHRIEARTTVRNLKSDSFEFKVDGVVDKVGSFSTTVVLSGDNPEDIHLTLDILGQVGFEGLQDRRFVSGNFSKEEFSPRDIALFIYFYSIQLAGSDVSGIRRRIPKIAT